MCVWHPEDIYQEDVEVTNQNTSMKHISNPFDNRTMESGNLMPIVNGRGTMPSKPKRPVLPPATEGDISNVYPFSKGEYNKGVAALKNNKADGRDDILVEQLKHLGPKTHTYKLYERMILNRIAPAIEQYLIKEQAGFISGKS